MIGLESPAVSATNEIANTARKELAYEWIIAMGIAKYPNLLWRSIAKFKRELSAATLM